MRWKSHVRFGGRAGETDSPRGEHRAPVRSHLANAALDEVRRRVQQSTLGHRGRKGDPLYRARRRLLAAHERLGPQAWERVVVLLEVGDPAGEVGAAYLAKELLREVYDTALPGEARRRLGRFHDHCRASDVVELKRLSRTIAAGSPRSSPGTPPGSPTGPPRPSTSW